MTDWLLRVSLEYADAPISACSGHSGRHVLPRGARAPQVSSSATVPACRVSEPSQAVVTPCSPSSHAAGAAPSVRLWPAVLRSHQGPGHGSASLPRPRLPAPTGLRAQHPGPARGHRRGDARKGVFSNPRGRQDRAPRPHRCCALRERILKANRDPAEGAGEVLCVRAGCLWGRRPGRGLGTSEAGGLQLLRLPLSGRPTRESRTW